MPGFCSYVYQGLLRPPFYLVKTRKRESERQAPPFPTDIRFPVSNNYPVCRQTLRDGHEWRPPPWTPKWCKSSVWGGDPLGWLQRCWAFGAGKGGHDTHVRTVDASSLHGPAWWQGSSGEPRRVDGEGDGGLIWWWKKSSCFDMLCSPSHGKTSTKVYEYRNISFSCTPMWVSNRRHSTLELQLPVYSRTQLFEGVVSAMGFPCTDILPTTLPNHLNII